MSKKVFEAIKAGLEDAAEYARGDNKKRKTYRVKVKNVDVRKVREGLSMSQAEFAEAFGVSPATIKNWEQERRQPEGPARVLLNVIARYPKVVLKSIAASK